MRKYLLRWCYHFHGNKPSKRGQWLNGGEGEAASVSRENLRCAVVEAKDIITREVFPLYECDGQDFVLFQWKAALAVQTGVTRLDGLRMICRDQYVEVFVTGEVNIHPITRPDYDFQSLKR